jgi:dihydroorotate dehydrogenase (fumarate)
MDLRTSYLGLSLEHPLMVGPSPLASDLDVVRRLEDAGAAAIVMHSLYEEQIASEQVQAYLHADDALADAHPEASSYLPPAGVFALAPDRYLEQLRRVREAVAVPVVASLNGTTEGGWIAWAKAMESAGAHALELNLHDLPGDPFASAADVESRRLAIVRAVTRELSIPVAVKLLPAYTSLPHFVWRLEEAGARGVVLFDRLYQADIDPVALELDRAPRLSDSGELLLRLRWLAILSPQTRLSLAASGGVHTPVDAVKALMAGAHAVQVVSVLLREGPQALRGLLDGLVRWMEEHEYPGIDVLRGSMSRARCPDPAGWERADYVQVLQGWRGGAAVSGHPATSPPGTSPPGTSPPATGRAPQER